MADLLTDYLRQAARKPWAWGRCDCFLFFLDWVERVTGIDPMADTRGTYDTERQARRILQRAGGPIKFVQSKLAPLGLPMTARPQAGDVGLVQVPLKPWRDRMIMVPAGAICVRPGLWAVKAKDAMTYADHPQLAAWALPAVAQRRPEIIGSLVLGDEAAMAMITHAVANASTASHG